MWFNYIFSDCLIQYSSYRLTSSRHLTAEQRYSRSFSQKSNVLWNVWYLFMSILKHTVLQ